MQRSLQPPIILASRTELQKHQRSPQALEQNLNTLERTVQKHHISGTALPQTRNKNAKIIKVRPFQKSKMSTNTDNIKKKTSARPGKLF